MTHAEQLMDIYASPGEQVRFTCIGGHPEDRVAAKAILELGKLYTVASVTVDRFESRVHLEEVPNRLGFNTCLFSKKDAPFPLTEEGKTSESG